MDTAGILVLLHDSNSDCLRLKLCKVLFTCRLLGFFGLLFFLLSLSLRKFLLLFHLYDFLGAAGPEGLLCHGPRVASCISRSRHHAALAGFHGIGLCWREWCCEKLNYGGTRKNVGNSPWLLCWYSTLFTLPFLHYLIGDNVTQDLLRSPENL